ncbi:polynucleotide adenylyltransferase PcnB [Aliikangiella sp. G2MR2-5]|uniref:polynucleotide adenylyltransferase PcnB n=1 Tax=Aliikangiella sp. G2MR2-5 TaxID=2788943 RepID=UPI0018A944F6|nr:polynucleotide adenylyltransferase PcnB [Aliikangiella sp. G2MR2-5]
MLKKLWNRLSPKSSSGKRPQKRVLERSQHQVSRNNMSPNALKVLYRLNNAGYEAYLVGGGVRDMMLGLKPKDFDIATSATPEQVARLFKNCRLIGRRFRLAHILFGREVIEVATFRASHDEKENQHQSKVSEQGLLVRDNVYGSLEEDAVRRDFTVNALYYCAKDFTVVDFTGGIEDLEKRQLRLIGEPATRYTEDPVRILRAIRLSAKLGLSIEEKTAAPIEQMSELLEHVSPARLWDECNKLFLGGHALATWQLLIKSQIAQHLFQQSCTSLKNDSHFAAFLERALESTDRRIAYDQPVTPAFLFAVLLWQPLQEQTERFAARGMPKYDAGQKAASRVLDIQRRTIAIPKRFSITMREIWNLQFRLFNRKKRNVDTLIQHPKFRAAYDFLCLRANETPELKALADWWTEFQEADPRGRMEILKSVHSKKHTENSGNKRDKEKSNITKSRRRRSNKHRKPNQYRRSDKTNHQD